eukprot:m.105600 g.105600  ORF g.105600 m.105600 type:complete len:108 (-) comp13883_c0_seq8:511-834(-)
MLTSAQDVTHLKNLTSLNLSGNQLKRVPKGLNNLVNLEELDLQQNQITHMETGLPRLKKLLELKLRDNRLKTIPCSLSGLESLNVYSCIVRYLELYCTLPRVVLYAT